MNYNEYQNLASRTLIAKPDAAYTDHDMMILWNAFGLAGEAGEVANVVGNILDSEQPNPSRLSSEIGDLLWYAAALCTKLDTSFSVVAEGEPTEYREILFSRGRGYALARMSILLSAKVGGLVDYIKKAIFHRHNSGAVQPAQVLVMLYETMLVVKMICELQELSIEKIMQGNVAKLMKRYPQGYSSTASENRPTLEEVNSN